MYHMFFLTIWRKVKLYNFIKNNYKCLINVKCIKLDNKKMNKNYANWAEWYGGNSRVHYDVVRPYFQGIVNGKSYTFVRTHDIYQPIYEVGENYTIFLQNLNDINCQDFYEKNEITIMKILIHRKKKKYSILIGLSFCFSIVCLILLF